MTHTKANTSGPWLTVVYKGIQPGDEAEALIGHAKMSAASWSHALQDRDAAIEQALAAPVQEPVAWTVSGKITDWSKDFSAYQTKHYTRPVYTPPAQPAPVPLTDEQVDAATKAWFENDIVAGRNPFEKRMRAALAAAHGITDAPEKGQA